MGSEMCIRDRSAIWRLKLGVATSRRRRRAGAAAAAHARALERPTPYTKYLVGVRMSTAGEAMPGLERQRWLDRVAASGIALRLAHGTQVQGEREIVLAAVAQYGKALRSAAAELKGDREVVLAAVAQDGNALEYAAAELKGDCLLYTSPSPRDGLLSRMPSSA